MKHAATPRVAVFGAGVAGLTAAHELIERGFRVRVYEPAPPGPNETICGIGGMARTQFSRVEIARGEIPGVAPEPGRQTFFVRTGSLSEARAELLSLSVPFAPGRTTLSAEAKRVVSKARRLLAGIRAREIWVRGHTHDPALTPHVTTLWKAPPAGRQDFERAREVAKALETRPGSARRFWPVALGYGHPNDHRRSDAERCYVDFQIVEDLLPGEHGFRFFPSFYRHVFDTMDRIPLARDPGGPLVESGRTVRDHLVSTTSQGIAFEGAAPFEIPRRLPRTVHELLEATKRSLEQSGVTSGDAALLGLKLLEYATSCRRRRERLYEAQSWWDFVEGDRYSARARQYLDSSPQMLVAMRAKQSDARTIGNITVQLLLDQLRHGENTDRTLSGPTSVVWFAPWRRHLERQGVEFVRGRLVRYESGAGGAVAVVRQATKPFDRERAWRTKAIALDYYVVALPAEAARDFVEASGLDACPECGKVAGLDLGPTNRALPGGLSEHLSGVQFYLRSEVSFVKGHTIYPDSEWGLSSIAQPQFWTQRRGWWDGYRGLLSVDIGNWHARSSVTGKAAWESTADEIAKEVWRQIAKDPSMAAPPEAPLFYHLDENIVFGADGTPSRNRTPMLINRTGTYRRRAGTPGAYHLHDGQLAFAGTHMQTFTRLTTMESANESARHAVCAILRDDDFRGDDPMIADPEDHEIEDLAWLVAIDERLDAEGLPHLFDIVGELPLLGAAEGLVDLLRQAASRLTPSPPDTLRISRGRRGGTP